ncbi:MULTISPECIES: hypothetical protein [Aquidulcibacter]|uniref:hypothetical protein n=1 Tax=Aquidulcibacter TaxID=2052989 RepID=UPI000A198C57|nr:MULTISPECIES: hypothetical protein [Aquidulcibacter]MCA3691757.1 hypothetical protein [Aquidulcibacter sp.]
MLFLFNDRVLMLTGNADAVINAGIPATAVARYTLNDSILAVQTAIMEMPNLASEAPQKAAALAWLIASRSDANAILFIAPPKCRRPQEVGFRLATVSLTTLGSLKAQQDAGRLTPGIINTSVWQSAAA